CFCSLSGDRSLATLFTLSLHDALPIFLLHIARNHLVELQEIFGRLKSLLREPLQFRKDRGSILDALGELRGVDRVEGNGVIQITDRKSTRLNSSHVKISYAVFCLKQNI